MYTLHDLGLYRAHPRVYLAGQAYLWYTVALYTYYTADDLLHGRVFLPTLLHHVVAVVGTVDLSFYPVFGTADSPVVRHLLLCIAAHVLNVYVLPERAWMQAAYALCVAAALPAVWLRVYYLRLRTRVLAVLLLVSLVGLAPAAAAAFVAKDTLYGVCGALLLLSLL